MAFLLGPNYALLSARRAARSLRARLGKVASDAAAIAVARLRRERALRRRLVLRLQARALVSAPASRLQTLNAP